MIFGTVNYSRKIVVRFRGIEFKKGTIFVFENKSKTEREVEITEEIAHQNGFKDIKDCETLKAGDKVYWNNRGKSMYLAIIGERNIEEGINIIGYI